jgi:hypothetical protein
MAKAWQPETKFKPVQLELETQEEVNAIFALCNHITLMKQIPILADICKALDPYRTSSYEKMHTLLGEVVSFP